MPSVSRRINGSRLGELEKLPRGKNNQLSVMRPAPNIYTNVHGNVYGFVYLFALNKFPRGTIRTVSYPASPENVYVFAIKDPMRKTVF